MAIDDNTSYELTGAQVKDLANKIKGKAADNTFVGATSAAPGSKGLVPEPQAGEDTKFLSGDGTWQTAPIVNNGALTIQQNGTTLDTFTANSATDKTVNIQTITAETVAPAEEVGAITASMIANGAVTAEKIDWTTFDNSSANVGAVAVGTSYVTLTTIPITSDGLYFLIANLTRTSNSTSGAIVYLRFKRNSNTLRVFTAPTVPNYAGNHEPMNLGFVVFSASAGDSVTIDAMKDNNNYNSALGTQYSLVKIA